MEVNALILNAVCFPDVLVFIYESTWCHFPDGCIFVGLFCTAVICQPMEGAKEVMDSYCSSDDEVFFGPITINEIKKTLTMRRRTQVLNRTSE